MLSGVDNSNLTNEYSATASMTHPHPVKQHVEKFTHEEQKPVREELSKNLQTMIYVKHLEDIMNLYDLYEFTREKKDRIKICSEISKSRPSYAFCLSLASLAAFLKYKQKVPLLEFNSYLNNIYAGTFLFGFTYTFATYFIEKRIFYKRSSFIKDLTIMNSLAHVHSEVVDLTNRLRFNKKEAY